MPFGKWKDLTECVADLMGQGNDEESAKKTCRMLQARLGEESFGWAGDIESHERNLIRGKALRPIKTVHPEEWPDVRVYLEEELEKAAHTLSGKPLLLDHLYPIDGKVLSAEYEDGAIEYVAELGDDLILGWVKDGKIRHCSVEYDWSNLTRLNGVAPKGLQFTGLALLKNFQPGDPETTVEVWEGIIQRLRKARGKVQVEPDGHQHTTEGMASEDAEDGEREELQAQAIALQTEVKAPQQALQSENQDTVAAGVLSLRPEAHEESNEEPDALRTRLLH